MAPIFTAATGVIPQIVDDERLLQLQSELEGLDLLVPLRRRYSTPEEVELPLDIDRLISLLEPWQRWTFEEQIDLQEWIQPLNTIDACLSYYIQKYPNLLLIGPVKRTKSRGAGNTEDQPISKPAETLQEVQSVPAEVYKNLSIILRFLSGMLLNASSKNIFNSVEELVDLLAAANDEIASLALEAICNVAIAPSLHRQQAPELQQHTSALHNSKTESHRRLVALARGWGSRGSGLGLYTCVTADDSEFGQGALPQEAGELHFSFFQASDDQAMETSEVENDANAIVDDESQMVTISLDSSEFLVNGEAAVEPMKTNESIDETSKQKRRRVVALPVGESKLRSSAELFFSCLEKAGGRDKIPPQRIFGLLGTIRLSRSFHCRSTRVAAVERRLRALIIILNAHPSPEVLIGYFQAQPELCVELVDLLRPTVSSAAVSAASARPTADEASPSHQDAIAVLANNQGVTFGVRKLAVETLTALVSRRDGTGGELNGVARHSNVLNELGVGKGQYLGLFPTLIRFSLASFAAFLSAGLDKETEITPNSLPQTSADDAMAFEIGLAFVEATKAPQLPREEQFERALEFIESVLTLATAVVSTPSGTAALTDCGLIPALLNTVSLESEEGDSGSSISYGFRVETLRRFVTAQAVQILEGAIVTHSNALSAFHNLNGVEVLTARLVKEIGHFQRSREATEARSTSDMDCDKDGKQDEHGRLQSSRRVLLFGIVTCLTVVFHQESTSSSATAPSGATELRNPEMTKAITEIIENAEIYGGSLVSLIATLLSDVMNSDPHVVRHIHKSGLAKSFIEMLVETRDGVPILPAVPELIMAVPNVLSALALTEDSAQAVKDANPFPALLRIFHHPKYAMPQSRCLLNEMTAIVGTGLDEIMRHVNSLRPLVCDAIVEAMNTVSAFGDELLLEEEKSQDSTSPEDSAKTASLENQRSCLMQYVLNFGQILEQVLHTEDHCDPFISAGGLEALLKLYPYMMPSGTEFLSHISCLSCPSVSTLTHSTTEDSLLLAFKCIALRHDSFKLLQAMINHVSEHITTLEKYQLEVRKAFVDQNHGEDGLDASRVLDALPTKPIYTISSSEFHKGARILSLFLRQVVVVQFMTGLLSNVIKASCQRSHENGPGWIGTEKEWKKELSSTAFEELVVKLSRFCQSAIFEVCRIRTQESFEELEMLRLSKTQSRALRYRLRIVCPEGAVVRDGIEIDSCASVGSMEMGEIVDAYDRCVNSSGVLRYRTQRGWFSEQTRGHGREPIAEVLKVWEVSSDDIHSDAVHDRDTKGRVEAGVPDLRSTGANILARVQNSYVDLFSALTRVVAQGVRSLPPRSISFQPGTIGAHVATMLRILKSEILNGFTRRGAVEIESLDAGSASEPNSCLAMYQGCLTSHLHSCLFADKGERRMVNVPLLVVLLGTHNVQTQNGNATSTKVAILSAFRYIMSQSLMDFKSRAADCVLTNEKGEKRPRQSVGRSTAASLPPVCSILRRLLSSGAISSSPLSSVLTKIKSKDFQTLCGASESAEAGTDLDVAEDSFSPEKFTRQLLSDVSDVVFKTWIDPRFAFSPAFVAHPVATLVTELMSGLEDVTKEANRASSAQDSRDEMRSMLRSRNQTMREQGEASRRQAEEEPEEPSEDALARLMEMGFTRDHALDAFESTGTSRWELALEYALTHPPPSPTTVQRRQAEREARRQRREQSSAANEGTGETNESADSGENAGNAENADSGDSGEASDPMAEDNKESSEADKPAPKEDETITSAREHLTQWKSNAADVVCDILSASSGRLDDGKDAGDGETEALTVVLSSFLLEFCQRYPDQTEKVATGLFKRVKEQLEEVDSGGAKSHAIKEGQEKGFAALCHSSVLFTRAFPNARKLVLKEDLIHPLVSCVMRNLQKRESDSSPKTWPSWLASVLLFLDIMAQPVVAFSTDENEEVSDESELRTQRDEHKKQTEKLSKLASDVFAALYDIPVSSKKSEEGDTKEAESSDTPSPKKAKEPMGEEAVETAKPVTWFQSVPAYFHLLPVDCVDSCIDICMKLMSEEDGHIPPGVAHSTLLLMMRLLRSPSVSTKCMKLGAAEKIIAMTKRSRFTGHTGLATLIFRRLLEDDAVLQATMENEIRSTVTRLYRKKEGTAVVGNETVSISRRSFVQAITPLLCRDPTTFLKAVSVSVRFEQGESGSGDAKVTLLSTSDRLKNVKKLSELLQPKKLTPSSPKASSARRASTGGKQKRSSISGSKSKTPSRSSKRRSSTSKSKKDKTDTKEKNDGESKIAGNPNPIAQIISLLIGALTTQVSEPLDDSSQGGLGFESSFLWAADILEVLADLVLAIPACATAIHKYRPSRVKDRQIFSLFSCHALSGRPSPPRTFVSFMLHSLLPLDRRDSPKDQRFWDSENADSMDEDVKAKKKAAFRRTKAVQSTARLLIALVARPGEGRRRVISELAFALSGGAQGLRSSHALPPQKPVVSSQAKELHALQAWGELCIGLAAPRSNGSNYDGNSTLSFEVVRIMLESGMAHALLIAVHRVPLYHPMATATVGSLIIPFEILSRSSVGDHVKGIVEKEKDSKESKDQVKVPKPTSAETQSHETSQPNDAFADDHMLEDAFGMEAARRQAINEPDEDNVEYHEASDDEMDDMDVDEGIEAEEVDDEEDMSSSEEESEESSEIEDSGDDEDSDSDNDSDDEEEDDDSEIDDDEEVEVDEDVENDFGFGAGYGAEMLGDENQDFDGDEGNDRGEGALDDGWTRIESSGLGGGLMSARRSPLGGGGGSMARNRGIIDAAEEMIGTLLRTGEISGDALAEIEGSLGIRIMPGVRGSQLRVSGAGSMGNDGMFMSGAGGGRNSRGGETRSDGIVGTVPYVHQRNQPDVGYTAFGFGGRWNETSAMEYVYGGPSMTACSRNYDLLSPFVEHQDNDGLPTLSQLDGRLFPGGPASATHARTQNSSHPLLCGVDLPPINSLVSDLLPHGARATRRVQLSTRRPGDWTSSSFSNGGLVATSNGNIVRANRSHGSVNSIANSRAALGPVGWTDEGLPFDSTVDQFSSTFEQALGEAMAASMLRADVGANEEPMAEDSEQGGGDRTSGEQQEHAQAMDAENQPQEEDSRAQDEAAPTDSVQESNEGDRVASSLADGLRLSPGTEESMGDTVQNNEGDGNGDIQMEDVPNEGQSGQQNVPEAATSQPSDQNGTGNAETAAGSNAGRNELVCPPGMDADVFAVLPIEMQREVVEQARSEADLAAQLDAGSTLDLEALAALPEDMRREVIEQEQRERRMNEAPADPANAEEMDNASFVASLAPDLRNEILLTADDAFLQSLPPTIIAEAQLLRERASSGRRNLQMAMGAEQNRETGTTNNASNAPNRSGQASSGRDQSDVSGGSSSRRRQRVGKLRVECDRDIVVYLPPGGATTLSTPVSTADVKAMLRLMYLLSPVRPQRLLQKVFQNLSATPMLRRVLSATFIKLLHDDRAGALDTLGKLQKSYSDEDDGRSRVDLEFADSLRDFPPGHLIGTAPEILDTETLNPSFTMLRRKQTSDTVASIAANLPTSSRGSRHDVHIPPVVATRMVETLLQMCKSSPRFCVELLIQNSEEQESMFPNSTGFEILLDLLRKPRYSKSSSNLEQLLTLLEAAVSPLSQLSKHGEEEVEISKQDIEAAANAGKEWLDVPRIVVSQERLQALCAILRMETCRDAGFARVNTIARRLCRVDANRGYVLAELASVARALGVDAIRDLKALGIRMSDVARQEPVGDGKGGESSEQSANANNAGSASNSVAVSTSTSELKLLRVLQTLQALCIDPSEDASNKKNEGVFVTEELVQLLRAMNLDDLWAELTNCLKIVQVLEGVKIEEDADKKADAAEGNDGDENEEDKGGKILQSSIAGLLTRFLPSIEAFFVANASSTRIEKSRDDAKDEIPPDRENANLEHLVGGKSLVDFVTANKVLLNALVRTNANLLDRGLKALISVPRCRQFLDFDVKRQWFKTQVRRLRQQASRRHGSLRLHIRRRHVFEDAYHALRLRNADEMRGRLHITFRNEDGVDAGGLSREFFGILSKEMFNPNYALFTSTEDGSTFQPNPNSSINPDHLSYFRFVGRIVGKAVSDGYLLDAHFTRSLYKHMLGIKPTHDDMEAIDPDYYKNLKTILEYNLDDLGLDLTFSTEDHSFGRTRMVDLLPNGRNSPVTEQNKSTYVSLVCQHRMTTAIKSQIKAYLDGFHELVSPDLIQIFSPRELELLISGLPDIDVHDLKQNTDYVGWKAADKQIQWFWNVLFSLTRNQKAAFLQFVTGSSKVPLAGFGELPGMRGVQKFSIHKAGGSSGALMSAHTCFNSLDLPVYNSEEELKEKLLYAINEGGGTFQLA
mmetsp:Transcript_3628/g.8298  ORF Transcript_3628/g.8298 Transcript_3628/m.8298 type:complete len:4344 (+) Transcript_3628:221-13252(+)